MVYQVTIEGSSNNYREPKAQGNYLRVPITPKCSIYSDYIIFEDPSMLYIEHLILSVR